jgi:hypothetical protein
MAKRVGESAFRQRQEDSVWEPVSVKQQYACILSASIKGKSVMEQVVSPALVGALRRPSSFDERVLFQIIGCIKPDVY